MEKKTLRRFAMTKEIEEKFDSIKKLHNFNNNEEVLAFLINEYIQQRNILNQLLEIKEYTTVLVKSSRDLLEYKKSISSMENLVYSETRLADIINKKIHLKE